MPAFLAPWAAKLAGSLIGWLVILGVIGGLFGAVIWYRHDAIASGRERDAAIAQLASAVERANGNHDAAEIMRLQIEADKRTIEMQGAEIDKWQADSLAMKQTNDALVRKGRDDRDRSLAEIAAKEEEIRALEAPDTIHRLSPPVRALASSLSSE